MLNRIVVTLSENERQLLQRMCEEDYRGPKEMLLYFVNLEAQRRGLVPQTFREVAIEQRSQPKG